MVGAVRLTENDRDCSRQREQQTILAGEKGAASDAFSFGVSQLKVIAEKDFEFGIYNMILCGYFVA